MSLISYIGKRSQQYQCGSKIRYDEKGALYASYVARKRSGESILHYHCPWCDQWHIGHRPNMAHLSAWQKEWGNKVDCASDAELLEIILSLYRDILAKKSSNKDSWRLGCAISTLRARLKTNASC